MKYIRTLIISALVLLSSAFVVFPAVSYADAKADVCASIGGCNTNANQNNGVNVTRVIKVVINVFSAIVGVVAVIMIIVAGLRFITSAGDASNIAKARSTILYAIVGLVVVALAQVIVHFALAQANQAAAPCVPTRTTHC